MNKCSAFILLACALGLLTAERVEAAPVTWDFVANSCSTFSGTGCDPKQQYPALIATLTLTGPDSSGSAVWGGDGPPAFTGDGFSLDFSSGYRPLTSAFAGNPTPFGECEAPREICSFDLSWSETAGVLGAVDILVNGFNDSLGEVGVGVGGTFGLTGGLIGTDDTYFGAFGPGLAINPFSGCSAGVCNVTGSWVNASLLTAPEPGSLALLAGAFGVWGLIGRRCTRLIKPRARAHEMRADDEG
jgi:hypothetical protein